MWPNISLNCLPQDNLNVTSYLKRFLVEEKNPEQDFLQSNNMTINNHTRDKIEDSLKNGAPDFSGLTKEEVADSCKYILQILPNLSKKSEVSDKNMLDGFIEKLYNNFSACICNTCKSKLDNKLPNPKEKIKFAFHKIVEMQEKDSIDKDKSQEVDQIGFVKSISNDLSSQMFCMEYHSISDLDDLMVFNGVDNTCKDKSNVDSVDSVAGTNSIDKSPEIYICSSIQSSPKSKVNEIAFHLQLDFSVPPTNSENLMVSKDCSVNPCNSTDTASISNQVKYVLGQSNGATKSQIENKSYQEDDDMEIYFGSLSSTGTYISDSNNSIGSVSDNSDITLIYDSVMSVDKNAKCKNQKCFYDCSDDSESEGDNWDYDDTEIDVGVDDFGFACGGLMLCNLVTVPPEDCVADEFTKLINEANTNWEKHANNDWKENTPTSVNFDEVVRINEWDDSDENRKSPWVEEGVNRMRFQKRIEEVNNDIGWIFDKVHRDKILSLQLLDK